MSTRKVSLAGTLATLLAVGCNASSGSTGPAGPQGPTGPQGIAGAQGSSGPPGATGPTGAVGATGAAGGSSDGGVAATGTVNVTVSDGNGDGGIAGPLAGVTVTAETTSGSAITPGSGLVVTATTSAAGAAALTLPFGVYDLAFTLAGYSAPPPTLVGVVSFQQVAVAVTLNEAASSKPSLSVVAAGTDVGFGQTVALTANASSPLGSTLSYSWSNTTAFGLGSVTGSGAAGTLITPTLAAAAAGHPDPAASPANLGGFVSGYAIPATFGKLPILNDTNGSTTASVTVSDGHGLSTTASVTVAAASVQNSTHAAAVGTRVFLNAGSALPAGTTWSLTPPSGSSATLDDSSAQYPSFLPDLPGKYVATLGTRSLPIYAGSWVGVIDNSGSTTEPVTGTVPYTVSSECTVCHQLGGGGFALDMFTPWMSTPHAIKLTYYLDGQIDPFTGTAGNSGQSCLQCHSVGYDPGNSEPALAGGMSAAELDAGFVVGNAKTTPWASVPQQVAQLADIQCENCHGPQGGNGQGGFNPGHTLTDVGPDNPQPFQSPRISYAADVCGQCHAAGTSHHDYSEWATTDATHPSGSYDGGMGHSNLATAQAEGLQMIDAGVYQLNDHCGRCHTAQGYTQYVANLAQGNVGYLAASQQGIGQVTPDNVQPQTCVACHDPHQDQLDPITGEDEHQVRVYDSIALLPSGFGVTGMGTGAVCISCHNSRNGSYDLDPTTQATTAAYLHEDTDPIGSNPLSAAATSALGTTPFSSFGAPHEANQGDVFEGRNAYFLGDQEPVLSPHSAVKDTCVGCHMINNPNSYLSHGSPTHEMHLFAITDAQVPVLCNSCHGGGDGNVDGASLQASVVAGLATVLQNMEGAVVSRVNDAAGAYAPPPGYGSWTDTGTITLPPKAVTDSTPGCTAATDPSCGLASTAAVTIGAGAGGNPLASVALTANYRGLTAVLTFASPVDVVFASGTRSLSSFTVNLANLEDGSGHPLFAPNGNLFKAGWNYALISQDESKGVHNPPFVSAVLSATAHPPGNPNATPPQPGGLWY